MKLMRKGSSPKAETRDPGFGIFSGARVRTCGLEPGPRSGCAKSVAAELMHLHDSKKSGRALYSEHPRAGPRLAGACPLSRGSPGRFRAVLRIAAVTASRLHTACMHAARHAWTTSKPKTNAIVNRAHCYQANFSERR